MRHGLRFAILAGIFLALFTLYPQFKLWYVRGAEWQGNYAYNDIDEVAYAAYLRALIDGRPRRNDPYTGRDDVPSSPQPESLFSIQFAAPYTVALPARLLGIGAPWAMTIAGAAAGFAAAFVLFWLLWMLTGNPWAALAGSLAVLAGGALAAGEGAIGGILDIGQTYPYFPAFRRYIPAVAFPFFFLLCALSWRMLAEDCLKRRIALCIGSSLCFSYTVFSYFYLWTAAAGWLATVFVLFALFRPEGFRRDLKALAALGAACILPLVPYALLLAQRVDTMDSVQLLVRTHAPDFARPPIYVGLAGAAVAAAGALSGLCRLREKEVLFTLSLALLPAVLFNQQVLTGRSLQPIHYQVFIGNYAAAAALAAAVGIVARRAWAARPVGYRAAAAALTATAVFWGVVECHWTIGVLDWANEARDRHMAVARRLSQMAADHPDPHRITVLHVGTLEGDDLPTVSPVNVLWARHQHVFAGLSWEESKERYYQWLHYQGYSEKDLEELIRTDFVTMIALFGWGRHTDRLSSEYSPVTSAEIGAECARYADFVRSFDAHDPRHPQVSFVVVPEGFGTDLSNFDRWYERGAAETVEGYRIYTATPRLLR